MLHVPNGAQDYYLVEFRRQLPFLVMLRGLYSAGGQTQTVSLLGLSCVKGLI